MPNIQHLSAGPTDTNASDRRVTETFLAGGTISVGDAVCFDSTQTDADRCLYVTSAINVAAATGTAFGYAQVAATAGDKVMVTVKGYHEAAKVANGTLNGNAIVTSGTVGRGTAYGAADVVPAFAVALEDAALNHCDVWVIGLFA